jgi:hypothetical protein
VEIGYPNDERHGEQNRRKDENEKRRGERVETPLEDASPRAEPDADDFDYRNPGNEGYASTSRFREKETVGIAVGDAVGSGDFEDFFEIGFGKIGIEGDDFFEFTIPTRFDDGLLISKILRAFAFEIRESDDFVTRIGTDFRKHVGFSSPRKHEYPPGRKTSAGKKQRTKRRKTPSNHRYRDDRYREGEKDDEARNFGIGKVSRTKIRKREEVQEPRKRNRNGFEEFFDSPCVVVGDAVRSAQKRNEYVEKGSGSREKEKLRLADSLDGKVHSRNEVGHEADFASDVKRP